MGRRGVRNSLVFWVVFLGFYLNTKEKKIREVIRKARSRSTSGPNRVDIGSKSGPEGGFLGDTEQAKSKFGPQSAHESAHESPHEG